MSNLRILILICFCCFFAPTVIFADQFVPNNTSSVPVGEEGKPLPIFIEFHLDNLNQIDDVEENFEFTGILTTTWKDRRFAFDPLKEGVTIKTYQGDWGSLFVGWYPQVFLANDFGVYDKRASSLNIRPDGTISLSEVIHAVARSEISFRKYPFDQQRLEAKFQILGHDATQVFFQVVEDRAKVYAKDTRIPQWDYLGTDSTVQERVLPTSFGDSALSSTFVVSFNVERQSLFLVRLVIMPLMIISMLSWVVFWMERSSLGDRISVSFIGILTTVSYQIFVSSITPHLSYLTLMNGILIISFLIMCGTVIINLWVGACDKRGDIVYGDKIDFHCRWIFPLTYLGLLFILFAIAIIFF